MAHVQDVIPFKQSLIVGMCVREKSVLRVQKKRYEKQNSEWDIFLPLLMLICCWNYMKTKKNGMMVNKK